ncbi:MAG: hypothetical protein LC667_17255, partial [Thioalkalivibrio sp.]|nr:hypothetical protein [Thioalkalivibrio sp.]
MSRPLDRLEEFVRLTEEQYSKEKLRVRILELTQAVRETGERHRAAQDRLGAARTARQETLEETGADERRLAGHEQRIRAFAEANLDVANSTIMSAAGSWTRS